MECLKRSSSKRRDTTLVKDHVKEKTHPNVTNHQVIETITSKCKLSSKANEQDPEVLVPPPKKKLENMVTFIFRSSFYSKIFTQLCISFISLYHSIILIPLFGTIIFYIPFKNKNLFFQIITFHILSTIYHLLYIYLPYITYVIA